MKKLLIMTAILLMSAGSGFAFPVVPDNKIMSNNDVIKVQARAGQGRSGARGSARGSARVNRHSGRNRHYTRHRSSRKHYRGHRRAHSGYRRGHRGYRHGRYGYKSHRYYRKRNRNDALLGFGLGLAGGLIVNGVNNCYENQIIRENRYDPYTGNPVFVERIRRVWIC